VVKEQKRPIYLHFLLIWKDECPLPTYVRDQNLVVRGRNWRLIGCVFFISFEKAFKMKSQVANMNWFVFFNLKENRLKV